MIFQMKEDFVAGGLVGDLVHDGVDAGGGHHFVDLVFCEAAGLEVEKKALVDTADGCAVVSFDILFIAENNGDGLVYGVIGHEENILHLVADSALGAAAKVDRTAEQLEGLVTEYTMNVDRTFGLLADMVCDVVHIEVLGTLHEITDIGLQ